MPALLASDKNYVPFHLHTTLGLLVPLLSRNATQTARTPTMAAAAAPYRDPRSNYDNYYIIPRDRELAILRTYRCNDFSPADSLSTDLIRWCSFLCEAHTPRDDFASMVVGGEGRGGESNIYGGKYPGSQ